MPTLLLRYGCVFLLAVLTLSLVRAAEEPKPFFLPKNPVAAAYVLGRLSNKELIAAPRSEFVYVALLERNGLDKKYRLEALQGLAKLHGTDPVTELSVELGRLDQKGETRAEILRDLLPLLLQVAPAELAAKRAAFAELTVNAQVPLTRQMAWAALVTADGSPEPSWQQAASEPARLVDLLLAVPLIRAAGLRALFYPRIEPLLQQANPAVVRRAAITAIATVPGHDGPTFNTLASLVESGTERPAAVASLQRLPRPSWPKDLAAPLIDSLIAWLRQVPVEQRTGTDAVNAFQLASDLATLLPAEQAKAIGKTLRAIGVSVFVIHTIPEQMLFDKSLLVVEAGKPLEIILVNEDSMPHNIAVIKPGTVETVGLAAEKMAPDPDAQGRLYVPELPAVLYATRLVDPGQQARLSFTAPAETGDYQYVCTFPGHWRRMVGTLAVVKDVEAYLASHTVSAPKLTEWKLADLAAAAARLGPGANPAAGRELFTKLGCVQCHKVGSQGNTYGPDLTGVFQRWQDSRTNVLEQILEPSKVIADRYRNYEFELADGDSVFGLVVQEDADTVTIQTGPSEKLIQKLKKTEIKERHPQPSSVMPVGLLNTLSQEEIFDLLAFLESGGRVSSAAHPH
ncbi:MAG: c-type cytochrome [Verrucomicrobia bacterium]|nr:c-type cytochrome [Verrucomicrobiota bacterium]